MDQQGLPTTREHHFYVAIAKFLFYHQEHGIVPVHEPIKLKDAQQYGLSPLLLYGLTVAGLPVRWMTFTPLDQPRALNDILLEGWRSAEGLRGQPDILRVNRHIAHASPDLALSLGEIGVQVVVADARDKSLPASLRSAQGVNMWLIKTHAPKNGSVEEAVQALCRDAMDEHEFCIRHTYRGIYSKEKENNTRQWLELPRQEPKQLQTSGLDWKPGAWLSSWESSLPPAQPRYFHVDDTMRDRTWLLTCSDAPEDNSDDDDFLGDDYYCDNVAEITKYLVACWPNSSVEIAGSVGITLRELQWFISGKATLERQAMVSLETLLGIKYDESMGCYTGSGPCVLMARTPTAIKEAYENMSHGGDAAPYEIIPQKGAADPSWRYFVINTCGEPPSIVMSPRGEKITDRLPNLLINFYEVSVVSQAFYRDVVSTCARACREPAANIREMTAFAKRFEEQWIHCFCQPD